MKIPKAQFSNDEQQVILVFSKDRPDRLQRTLPNLRTTTYTVYLIDDSVSSKNQTTIRRLCTEFGIEYHGIIEQEKVIEQLNPNVLKKFVRHLGQKAWSLGYNRNYAVLYGLLLGVRKIILMDDDVLVEPPLLGKVFRALSSIPFVGVEITLMADHSIVGHIYRAGGDILPQYVSGTFLGIDLEKVRHYFINVYNEDWIWLFLENNGEKVAKIGSVKQLKYDPFRGWKSRIYFQEIGEILWDGLCYHSPPFKISNLTKSDYWNNILTIRLRELNSMANLEFPDDFRNTADAIRKRLFCFHRWLSPETFANEFRSYFDLLDDWRTLLKSLRSNRIALKKGRNFT